MSIATILEALIAIPKIGAMIESMIASISAWWINKQNADTKSAITDAIALDMRAKTDEDRYAAMDALQKALARGRTLS